MVLVFHNPQCCKTNRQKSPLPLMIKKRVGDEAWIIRIKSDADNHSGESERYSAQVVQYCMYCIAGDQSESKLQKVKASRGYELVKIYRACIAMLGWDTSKHFVEFKIVQSPYRAFNDNDLTQEANQAAIKVFDRIKEELSFNTMCRPMITYASARDELIYSLLMVMQA